MTNLDASRFLEDLTGRHARVYVELVDEMVVALARGNDAQFRDARDRLGDVIAETMGTAEVLGASLVLQRAAATLPSERVELSRARVGALLIFADAPTQTILPRITLEEALEDMVERTPVTIRLASERTARRISQLYGEGRVVAFARSAEAAVTKRVQSLISEAIREGIAEVDAGRRIVESVSKIRKRTREWTEGYARMAFRTNVNTAVTAGRFRQVQDEDIRAVIPAFMFTTAGGVDVRPNHAKLNGKIFSVDNPVWNRVAPPLGYNCRCEVDLMSLPELRRMGRIKDDGSVREDRVPAGAGPDEGFRHGGRPDLFIAGSAA